MLNVRSSLIKIIFNADRQSSSVSGRAAHFPILSQRLFPRSVNFGMVMFVLNVEKSAHRAAEERRVFRQHVLRKRPPDMVRAGAVVHGAERALQ